MISIENQFSIEISKESWQMYCKKNNIDFVLITEKPFDIKSSYLHKQFVFDYIGDKYEKIAIVDTNTLVKWNAPNFFDLYNDEFCGIIDNESLLCIENDIKYFENNFEELSDIDIHLSEYINTGVLFFTKEHKSFFEKTKCFYIRNKEKFDNGLTQYTEQTFLNLYLKKENIKKKYLDFRFNTMRLIKNDWLHYNWQLDEDKRPFFIKYSYIWHFTGCSIEERAQLMTQIWAQIKHLYG